MKEIKIFKINGKEIRTVSYDGVYWFVVKDVNQILGYSDACHAVKQCGVSNWDKRKSIIPNGNKRPQEMLLVNESGLYTLICNSKKEEARKIVKLFATELIPQLHGSRKHLEQMDNIDRAEYISVLKLMDSITKDIPNKYSVIRALLEPLGFELPELQTTHS